MIIDRGLWIEMNLHFLLVPAIIKTYQIHEVHEVHEVRKFQNDLGAT
jgi:hypothetical protein